MKNFLTIFNKKNQKHPIEPGQKSIFSLVAGDAFVDWTLIIITACIVGAGLIGVGGYVYMNTQAVLQSEGTVLPESAAASHFDVAKLKTVISTFDAHANQRVMLGKGYTGPKDPSLP